MRRTALSIAAFASLPLAFAGGCRSYHVDITVQNQTGAPVRLMEVDYPDASFGADTMAPGASMHYRIQVTGDGPLSLQYTDGSGHSVKNKGPALRTKQEGSLQILLLPAGKAEFHPGH